MMLAERRKEEKEEIPSTDESFLNSAAAALRGPKSQTWCQTFCPCF